MSHLKHYKNWGMRNFLIVLIVFVVVMLLALPNFENISSVFPGWNSHFIDNRFYFFVFVLNVIIPMILYFGIPKIVNGYIFSGYFLVVTIIFIISLSLVYDDITPGLANQNFQDYMALQRLLVYSTLLIHLLFYSLILFQIKRKTN